MATSDSKKIKKNEPIAIIGMAGRFPGANTIAEFWMNILAKKNSIQFFSDEELIAEGIDIKLLKNPQYVKAKGHLTEAESFDADFFKLTPIEAKVTDPQYRIFLELAWEALESAGYALTLNNERIGVFATSSTKNNYHEHRVLKNRHICRSASDYQLLLGHAKDFLATLVAYKLNCTGPAINLHTACSSSLVAVCMAAQSLRNGECELAIAGGVSIKYPLKSGHLYQEGMIYSPSGESWAFDENAQGIISADGAGIVVLKKLSSAQKDRDHIYAIIKGYATNNDGINKLGFTAPSISGQKDVIQSAHQNAQVGSDSIGYIETHGTGTPMGDSVELTALKATYSKKTNCFLGAVKNNIGHLDVASGVIGLLKATLALEHKTIPPNIQFTKPNSLLANSNFLVPTTPIPWTKTEHPRRAAVSSFGIGGTNAHLVLEEHSSAPTARTYRENHLIIISAKTPNALVEYCNKFANYFSEYPDTNLANVAYTSQVARKEFSYRHAIVCKTQLEAKKLLYLPKGNLTNTLATPIPANPVVFMFSGYGVFYKKIAHGLYESEPVFRQHMDRCFSILQPWLGDIKAQIFDIEAPANSLDISITHPFIFALEYALAQFWLTVGITPTALIGHSQGEYVAACLAGVFSLEEVLYIVYQRAALIAKAPAGGMLAISQSADTVCQYIQDKNIVIASVNAPQQCVVSGSLPAILDLQKTLQEQSIITHVISDRYAFHSPLLKDIAAEFLQLFSRITLKPPKITVISNLTAQPLKAKEAQNPQYWVDHLLQSVQFHAGITYLLQQNNWNFIEVGPGHSLFSLATQILNAHQNIKSKIISSMPFSRLAADEPATLLTAIGEAWKCGLKIDWNQMHAGERLYRIPLPTYPFERQNFSIAIDTDRDVIHSIAEKKGFSMLIPKWQPQTLFACDYSENKPLLFFLEPSTFSTELAHAIERIGYKVFCVSAGKSFAQIESNKYILDPNSLADYEKLFGNLANNFSSFDIVYGWPLEVRSTNLEMELEITDACKSNYLHLLYIAQAIEKKMPTLKVKLAVLTQGLQRINGKEKLHPFASLILGPVKVIPLEYPNISCLSIDFSDIASIPLFARQLLHELKATALVSSVAYRYHKRFSCTYTAVETKTDLSSVQLRFNGIYLITGGLGGIGIAIATFLAEQYKAHIILISRTELPPKSEWPLYLKNHPRDKTVALIKKLQNIECLASSLTIFSQDVSNYKEMQEKVSWIENHIGSVHGVIHSAGIPSGERITNKLLTPTPEVFTAKIYGTLVLNKIFSTKKLDFMFYNSGLTAITGAIGQVDYTAANAFLNAHAEYMTTRCAYPIISTSWDIWQETGMAMRTAAELQSTAAIQKNIHKNFIFSDVKLLGEKYIFNVDIKKPWVLIAEEHRLDDIPLAPATLLIEMARSAFSLLEKGNIKIFLFEDLHFLIPLYIKPTTQCRLVFSKKAYDIKLEFSIETRQDTRETWQQNAYGSVAKADESAFEAQLTYTLRAQQDPTTWNSMQTVRKSTRFILGERWNCLMACVIEKDYACGHVKLATQHQSDLDSFAFCPPLLDVALNFWQRAQEQQFIPFYCEKLLFRNRLDSELFAYTTLDLSNSSTLRSDSQIFDIKGQVLVTATQWISRKMRAG